VMRMRRMRAVLRLLALRAAVSQVHADMIQ
jgi:hypothetical protein